ncbi:MAG: polyphosphate:AMP phosphotransferase [Alphaproteobacteria bacterium CG_4_10_14_0_2_um_filter_63_37]|nr:MAG: polyphosphate:AMP phosphotransferase [Proteobacteria bacterium CG1_02_64_396]PJA25261.1 MAG: polyphosphate:AMP phosphotransferase [Alphaproteobacteria bacterium CG_4_10_14_0_2_um_filter_63_37]
MFEAAELGRSVSKQSYKEQLPDLRAQLLEAQDELRGRNIPVVVIIAGVDGAGKGETVNRLHEWLDPRGLEAAAFGTPSDEERERPRWWRFWRALPPRGKIGLLFGSWYTMPIIRRVYGETKNAQLDDEMARIANVEQMLVRDGALILKFWFHLSKKAQKKRLTKLESHPDTRWRVSATDWKHFNLYDKFAKVSERAIRRTDTGEAPWILVEAEDPSYRELFVGRTLLEAIRGRLNGGLAHIAPPASPHPVPPTDPKASLTILDHVDLKQKIGNKRTYERELIHWQGELNRLTRRANAAGRSTVVVFEGWDAAGKGGNIRRMIAAMDARVYRIIQIAAPTDEERAQHYLWRFWRHLPRAGRVTVYDRSWYGRVLVERVEGFAQPDEWMRAYNEINDFEEQLTEHGIILNKFWLHIDPNEQLRRFKEREEIPYKQYKITDEDWRNRERWPQYAEAVNEMVARTSTEFAPWSLIPANDKKFARIEVLKTVCRRLDEAL